MSGIHLTTDGCQRRRQRLLELMAQRQIDLVVLTQLEHVQWLTGARFAWFFRAAVALCANGRVVLAAPENRVPDHVVADEVITYPARWHSTMRNDQMATCIAALVGGLGRGPCPSHRIGCEFSTFPPHWPITDRTHIIDIEPELYRLRRHKESDELALIRRALEATEKMYQRAREIVRPGINELDVFNELQSVAVRELGEPLTATGNDYQSGQRGGMPRDRVIEPGELYILDLGPAYRGYFADNARTLAVTDPTDAQLKAWQAVCDVFPVVESWVRPGASARGLFEAIQQQLNQTGLGRFDHHLGHGIGLFPHEGPHLNPHWDDTFEAGDVFTAEPGLYGADLRAGLRLENDYLVTATGVELLTPYPLEL